MKNSINIRRVDERRTAEVASGDGLWIQCVRSTDAESAEYD